MKRRSSLNFIYNQIDCLLKETNAGEKQEEVGQEQQGQSGGTVDEVFSKSNHFINFIRLQIKSC